MKLYNGMVLRQVFFLVIIFMASSQESANAQLVDSIPENRDIFSLIQDDSFGGRIVFYQSPSLHVLIDKSCRLNKKNGINGYRIQIYSGSGVKARDRAIEVESEFMSMFPEFNPGLLYIDYNPPYFKVRVGDYRSKNEAVGLYHKLKKKYPGSYIVKSKINFPKLDSPENK